MEQTGSDSSSAPAKHWCFTINNPVETPEQLTEHFKRYGVEYVTFGEEIGKSGTYHYQGYVELSKKVRAGQLGKEFRGHFEKRRGTQEQAIDYATKDGKVHTYGKKTKPPHMCGAQANHDKWAEINELAQQKKFGQIRLKYPDVVLKYGNGLRKLASFVDVPDIPKRFPTEVYWFYGKPRTGKSLRAEIMLPNAYEKECDKWWDEYIFEEDVIVDEVPPDIPTDLAQLIKKWTDKRWFKAQVKGGSLGNIRPRRIILTSNYSINEVFNPKDAEAIEARCVQILYFNSDYNIITIKDISTPDNALPCVQSTQQAQTNETPTTRTSEV